MKPWQEVSRIHVVIISLFPPIQCYYIGAADISATKLVREVTRPLSFGKPNEKICENMKKKDEQICELRYGELVKLLGGGGISVLSWDGLYVPGIPGYSDKRHTPCSWECLTRERGGLA